MLHAAFHFGGKGFQTFRHIAHRVGQRFRSRFFADEAVHPGFERVVDVKIVLVGRDHEDAGGSGVTADLLRGIQPVHVGHGHVERDDIGFEFGGFFGAFASVGGLTHDFDVALPFEDVDERVAHHLVVVNYED